MTNYQPDEVADKIVTALYADLVLGRLVTMKTSKDKGPQASSVQFQLPYTLPDNSVKVQTAADREVNSRGLITVYPELNYAEIKAGDRIYTDVWVTEDWKSFVNGQPHGGLLDTISQGIVRDPSVGIEGRLARVIETLPESTIVPTAVSGAAFKAIMAEHTMTLRKRGVNINNAPTVIGSSVAQELIQSDVLAYSEVGNADTLRNASLGQFFGSQIFVSFDVDPLAVITFDSLAVGAVCIKPAGAQYSENGDASVEGFALGWTGRTDSDTADDKVVVSAFFGAGLIDPQRGLITTFSA